MNRKYWVYVHTCPNGKRYVGATYRECPEDRWNKGKGYGNQPFFQAIQEFGWENITHKVWEMTSESEMYLTEKYLISYYQTLNPEYGYNCVPGGKRDFQRTEEQKRKISKTKLGIKTGPHKTPRSEEHKKHLSEALKGIPRPWLKKPKSEETRKRMSEARRRVIATKKGT